MMNKYSDTLPIVTVFNDAYALPALTMIQSTIKHCSNPDFLEFHVLYKKIDPNIIALCEEFARSINTKIIFWNVARFFAPYKSYMSQSSIEEQYYPLIIPSLFDVYEKVVHLDADMLVRDNILELVSSLPKDKKVGATRCMARIYSQKYDNFGFHRYVRDVIKIKNYTDYFNGGMEVFNNILITKEDKERCFSLIKENWISCEEPILNKVFANSLHLFHTRWNFYAQYLKTNIYEFPDNFHQELREGQNNPAICHFVEHTKPWITHDISYAYEYNATMNSVKSILDRLASRVIFGHIWKRFPALKEE